MIFAFCVFECDLHRNVYAGDVTYVKQHFWVLVSAVSVNRRFPDAWLHNIRTVVNNSICIQVFYCRLGQLQVHSLKPTLELIFKLSTTSSDSTLWLGNKLDATASTLDQQRLLFLHLATPPYCDDWRSDSSGIHTAHFMDIWEGLRLSRKHLKERIICYS